MKNGRCYVHGGPSTGPRTPEGLERSRKANWKHGNGFLSNFVRRGELDREAIHQLLDTLQFRVLRERLYAVLEQAMVYSNTVFAGAIDRTTTGIGSRQLISSAQWYTGPEPGLPAGSVPNSAINARTPPISVRHAIADARHRA